MLKITQFLNLNNFKKVETLEKGKFGIVYRIKEINTGEIFVAKIPDIIFTNKADISREIEILQLDHPSIAQLVGFCPFDFDNNRNPVIITKYYSNRTLQQVLDLKRSVKKLDPWTNTKKLINIYGIASAMSFLHSHKIIHRDLSPLNVLQDDHLYPQISNFCLTSKPSDRSIFDLSSLGKAPNYMAPEVILSETFSFASDVYSFSLVAYEILTEEVPFHELRTIDMVIRVVKQNYRPEIDEKNIPTFFQKLIKKCWSGDPNKRPTFNEIARLLKHEKGFFNELQIDANEFNNYVRYIDEYLQNPQLNVKPNFSEYGIQKVSLFQKIERVPLVLDVKTVNLDHFKQLGRIGEGTFGTIYEVFNVKNGKKYAAKVFKRKYHENSEDKEKINNMRSEVSILNKLNHPAIVQFIGYSPTNFEGLANPIIFTEIASNRSLEQMLQLERNGFATELWNETKKLINIYGIASSMSYLHSLNILHRNLKPSNILIDEMIHPKLSGFGYSKDISNHEDGRTQNEKLLGTYAYISPEIYENLEYSKASDVYAFALIIYEILTNQKPFLGSTLYQIILNVTKGVRPEFKKDVPDCYKKLIEDCWAQDPKKRPTFNDIIKFLKTEKNFINEFVNQEEYLEYVYKIDKCQSRFDSKVLQIINYESIYQKQRVVLVSDGILDIKNYELKEKISNGNYSSRFKVIEKATNKIFSAYESNIEINYLFKDEINNLMKDISFLSSMNHPYILKFIGFSFINFNEVHKPIVITEYASNNSLEDFIDMERSGLYIEDWNDTKKLITIYGIAYCMTYLHSHDIVHYNLKPSNIIIDENYHPKICGFGFYKRNLISRCMDVQSIYNPKENLVYSTPEVLKSGKYTKASDVYSFALIVYELITKRKPYSNYVHAVELLNKIENNSFRPGFPSSIPDCYKELIEACWKQDPQERPSFEQVVNILKNDKRFIEQNVDKNEYFEFANTKYVEPEKYDLQQLMNAADNNDPKALFRFGLLYSKGIAMPLNQAKAARFYEKAAALGYAQAQCNLGKMYLRGYGISQDKKKAVELFEKAAAQGDAKALFNLGVLYFKGNGVEQDYKKTVEYYEKAVDLNDPEAQLNLGQMYNNGEGVEIDKKKAFELFQRSARYGNPMAQFNLAQMYQNGVDGVIQKDVKTSLEMYQKAAEQNLPQAQFNLALLYLHGEMEVPANKQKAIHLFEKAADQNYEEAKLYLDSMLSKSGNKIGFKIEEIVKKLETKIESIHNSLFTSFFNDITSTLTYIDDIFINRNLSASLATAEDVNKSLKKFNFQSSNFISNKSFLPPLKSNLSALTQITDDVNKLKIEVHTLESRLTQLNKQIQQTVDSETSHSSSSTIHADTSAIRSIVKKAESGDAKSQLALAAFYATGKGGLHMNSEKALKYYLMAAKQGNMNAQYAAATYFYYGRGTSEDKNMAFELFLKAAEQGHSKAQFALGHFYQFDAQVEEKNKESAMRWYKKAAKQGHEAAKKVVNGNMETDD